MTVRKIELMHRVFGAQGDGYYCRDCYHLCSYEAKRKWYKCEVYGITQSEASDWRLSYPACRQYNKKWDGNPIIRLVRPWAAPDTPLEGQESMFNDLFQP